MCAPPPDVMCPTAICAMLLGEVPYCTTVAYVGEVAYVVRSVSQRNAAVVEGSDAQLTCTFTGVGAEPNVVMSPIMFPVVPSEVRTVYVQPFGT